MARGYSTASPVLRAGGLFAARTPSGTIGAAPAAAGALRGVDHVLAQRNGA
jgi:hypothetical protein